MIINLLNIVTIYVFQFILILFTALNKIVLFLVKYIYFQLCLGIDLIKNCIGFKLISINIDSHIYCVLITLKTNQPSQQISGISHNNVIFTVNLRTVFCNSLVALVAIGQSKVPLSRK